MTRNFSFSDVKKYLQNKSAGEDILDAFSSIADVAIIFTPIMFGPQFLPLLETLDAKDRVVNAGKKLIGFIETKTAPNYKERMQQIDSAYLMLCVTAFFEALRENLSSSAVKEIIKYFKEEKIWDVLDGDNRDELSETSKAISIIFPNEVDSLNDVKSSLKKFYGKLCKNINEGFKEVVSQLERQEDKSQTTKKTIARLKKIQTELDNIPELALNLYIAQLVELMSSFSDFSAYIQLREFSELNTGVKNIDNKLCSYDIGLQNLSDLIKSIGSIQRAVEAEEICKDLKKYYDSEINKPIIKSDDSEENELAGGVVTEDEHNNLNFPAIKDSYISQAFKCLRYTGANDIKSIENPKMWDKLTTSDNIGDFFIKYLSSPSSVEYPLIVLGLPGSGKSILTKVLAAQLTCSSYTVIRIPLRDIDANHDIDIVIGERIAKDINRPLKDGYAAFAEHFSNNPLFVIFDGYDELLQVKGDVFNGFIAKIRAFQEQQSSLGRPLRVMITSRPTLIDQVTIPKNSVILSLEKFDEQRRNAWIKIWNNSNSEYFESRNVKPFHLKSEKNLSKNVKDCATRSDFI